MNPWNALLRFTALWWSLAAAAAEFPHAQAVPQPYDQISFQRDGEEIARYHFGPDLRRPFIFPANGPSGISLTRMGHPTDCEQCTSQQGPQMACHGAASRAASMARRSSVA